MATQDTRCSTPSDSVGSVCSANLATITRESAGKLRSFLLRSGVVNWILKTSRSASLGQGLARRRRRRRRPGRGRRQSVRGTGFGRGDD